MNLQSPPFLMLWKIFRFSANKRQLKLRIEFQISLMEALNYKGPKIEPCKMPDFVVYEREEKTPENRNETCLLAGKIADRTKLE